MGFLEQPIVMTLVTFFAICIAILVGLTALLRNMRSKQQARKKAAMDAELNPLANRKAETDDFDLFTSSSRAIDGDDPLADLYQSDFDDDDETDLASLLSDMGEEKVHTIAEGQVSVQLASGETTQARQLLSILRDEEDGRLMVLTGDTAYRTLLDDPEVKKQFTTIMKELSAIILKADTRPEKTTSEPVKAAKPEPTVAKPQIEKPKPIENQSIADDSEAKVDLSIKAAKDLEIEDRLPGDLPNMKLPDNPDNYKVGRFGRVSVKHVDKAPELNIAAAIEAYLQYKIEQNPEYQRRGIHIKPALGGGVSIEADGKAYDFVDKIADSDVREFIQTAINEWQERH